MPSLSSSKSGLSTFRPARPAPVIAVPPVPGCSSACPARSGRFLLPRLPLSGEIYDHGN